MEARTDRIAKEISMNLPEINNKLINLPGEIASKERELELAKVEVKKVEAEEMIYAENLSSQDLRRAFIDRNERVVKERQKEGILRAEYHGLINAFQGIQELARNTRQEMKSLKDGL